MPRRSSAAPDHSIMTDTLAVSSRRRSTCACSLGHSPSSTRPPSSSSSSSSRRAGRLVGHERDPAVGALRACRRGTRPRTTGTRGVGSSTAGSVRAGRYGTEVSPGDARRRAPADRRERFYVETLGCPKNAVDSDKVVASLLADGLVAAPIAPTRPTSSSSTPARSSRPPARSRSTSRSRSPTHASRGAQLVVTGCMAERYGDELAAALPEADAVVGFAGEGSLADVVLRGRKPAGVRDLLELPAARAERAVGVREGRRGLRPRVRVLRDPVVPRQAALAHAGVDRGRSARRSSSRASPRSCSSRRTSRGTAATPASPDRSRRCCAGSTRCAPTASRASACSTSTRPRCKDPLVSTMLELPTVVPYFDLSLQHAAPGLLRRMKRWGSGDRFLDDHRAASAPQEPDAAFRSSFIVGFPGETEADHDALLAFLADARLDWAGFFPFSQRRRHRGRDDGRHGRRRRSCASGCASVPRCRIRSPPRRAPRSSARRSRCSSTGRRRRRARRPHPPRGARDRRRRPARRDATTLFARPGAIVTRDRVRRRRPRSRGQGRRRDRGRRAAAEPRDEALRSERARDAGELRHDQRGSSSRSRRSRLIRDATVRRGSPSGCGSRSPRPTVSTAGSPGATARPARARSSIRSPTS